MQCRICKNSADNMVYQPREMMFGLRERFDYFQCSLCGCLQIAEIPQDMSRFYPSDYYSFEPIAELRRTGKWDIKEHLKKVRDRSLVFNTGLLGRLLGLVFKSHVIDKEVISRCFINFKLHTVCTTKSKILDVGCGAGQLLYMLQQAGFKNLLGVDPFIEEEIHYAGGLRILKKMTSEIEDQFDLIMLHHSLEHMWDQNQIASDIFRLLSDCGLCIVRIPLASSWAWEHYKENWVQLDAPRHFFLHSVKSFEMLLKRCGLYIEKIIYDSNEFQFTGSERYVRDIPLRNDCCYDIKSELLVYSQKEIDNFRKQAEELNASQRGDQAAFFIRKEILAF